jgi:hypothetical protein
MSRMAELDMEQCDERQQQEAEECELYHYEQERKMNKIAAALVRAQKAFAPALKTNTNPAFKSKYVGLDGCVEAVIDALNDNGIMLMQQTSECDNGVIVETVFIHESGETMPCGKLHVPAAKHDAQGYGSALTYARRYSLMAACGIAPEDDDGNAASKPAKRAEPEQNEVDAAWVKKLKDSVKGGSKALHEMHGKVPKDILSAIWKPPLSDNLKASAAEWDTAIANQA